jgi:hypothetical protein
VKAFIEEPPQRVKGRPGKHASQHVTLCRSVAKRAVFAFGRRQASGDLTRLTLAQDELRSLGCCFSCASIAGRARILQDRSSDCVPLSRGTGTLPRCAAATGSIDFQQSLCGCCSWGVAAAQSTATTGYRIAVAMLKRPTNFVAPADPGRSAKKLSALVS